MEEGGRHVSVRVMRYEKDSTSHFRFDNGRLAMSQGMLAASKSQRQENGISLELLEGNSAPLTYFSQVRAISDFNI